MPVEFDGSTDALGDDGWTSVTAAPLTMACWITPDTTDYRIIMALSDYDFAGNFALSQHNQSSGSLLAETYQASGDVYANSLSSGTVTANTMMHAAAVFTSASSRTVYADGVAGLTNTDTVTPAGITGISVGTLFSFDAPFTYFDGTVAHAALWNVALTQAEVTALASGVSPLLIRPSALRFYAPFDAHTVDVMGNATLSDTGTPTIATTEQPAIIRPSAQILQFPSSGGAAPGGSPTTTVIPRYYRQLMAG